MDANHSLLKVATTDPTLGLELIHGGPRDFWIRQDGEDLNGLQLLGYLLAEHSMIALSSEEHHVHPGDVVLDVGGHIGVFTALALSRGAAKVVAIEPEPRNFECLRRNFEREIKQGRVVLVQAGAWSKPGDMELHLNFSNSGMSSFVKDSKGSARVRVPVRPIDNIVSELGLPRVDLIKTDIEGAESEALKGAAGVLRKFRPRIVLDSYHNKSDAVTLPALIRSLNGQYKIACGPCEYHATERLVIPHVTFYF